MRNIRLLIAYDGADYHGWQIQPDKPTIQGEIERNLASINNGYTTLHGAGRTDAGVHAHGMVAHFNTQRPTSPLAYLKSLNSMLPRSIRILEVTEEPLSFHSRFSAKGKTYNYSIFNGQILLPHERHYSHHIKGKLNFDCINECLVMTEGTHDFACFETAGSRDLSHTNGKGSIRTITRAALLRPNPFFYEFSITGDGFLRHMVRNIVGTILEVGLQRRSVKNYRETLRSKKRSNAGTTAPAHGLTLSKIYY